MENYMNTKSIKFRITSLIAVAIFVIISSILYVSVSRSSESLVKSNMDLLDAVKESKKEHIHDFFSSVKNLLLAKSTDTETTQMLWTLDEGYEELEDFNDIDIKTIKNKLTEHYKKEYIPRINYKVKNSNLIRKCQSGHSINMILGIKFCGAMGHIAP